MIMGRLDEAVSGRGEQEIQYHITIYFYTATEFFCLASKIALFCEGLQ